jgi:hypothetical protein
MCLPGYSSKTTLVLPQWAKGLGGFAMAKGLNFHVETTDENVVVTLLGTQCMVNYRRATHVPGLTLFHARGDERAPCRSFQELNTQEARFAPRTLQAAQSPPFHLWIAHRCGASSRGKNDKGFPVSFVRYFHEPIISCVRKSHPNAANHLN